MKYIVFAGLMAALPAAALAENVTLNFNALPTTQGWTYLAAGINSGQSESSAFSIQFNMLQQDTLGFPMGASGANSYVYALGSSTGGSAQMTLSARVEAYEAQVYQAGTAYPYGFAFGFIYDNYQYYVGVAGSRIAFVQQNGESSYADFPTGFDASAFNTYVLTGSNGVLNLTVNGITAITAGSAYQVAEASKLYLGDGTAGANARAQVSSFGFVSSPVPEMSSWAMQTAGFGLVGATLRRRRVVALFA